MSTTTPRTKTVEEAVHPPRPPGPWVWLRENLFSTWYNSLLTIISLILIYLVTASILRWVFTTADWRPVFNHPLLYLVGQYPRAALWRVGIGLGLSSLLLGISVRLWGGVMRVIAASFILFLAIVALWPPQGQGLTIEMRVFLLANIPLIAAGYLFGHTRYTKGSYVLLAWFATLILTLALLRGFPGSASLPLISTQLWGGFLVTMLLAVGGIVLSFPIGVLLALGRRSSLPVVRVLSTTFIEVVRGVPLIGILFLSSLILPLLLPPEVRIDRLLRAMIGMTLFSAAYMAENVRGGLAAIPLGQVEAAKAVGLNNFKITLFIVLPQALRIVIPPIVGQFISLFKDTTLAAGVAVLELLSVGLSILQGNPQYFGLQMEVLLFISVFFWILSYLMSYASLKLEAALGVGVR